MDISKVTRVEVIDESGRAYVRWGCKAHISMQDNERTLKIFITKKEAENEIRKENDSQDDLNSMD